MGELLPFPTQLKKSDQKKIDSNNKFIRSIASKLNCKVTQPEFQFDPETDHNLYICSEASPTTIHKNTSELEYNTIQDDLANFSLERELYTITVQQNFLAYSMWKRSNRFFYTQIAIKVTGNIHNIDLEHLVSDKNKVKKLA